MADPIRQLLSQTRYVSDGSQTVWNFSFSGGYIDKSHVKAKYLDAARVEHQISVTPGMFLGQYQLNITPPIAAGSELVIYRDTPKEGPLVDFADSAALTEQALDLNAKQAVFVAAESSDGWTTIIEATNVAGGKQVTLATAQAVLAAAANDAAVASRDAAAVSAANALVSENVAGDKAAEASGHANAASGQAVLAANAAATTQTLRDSIIATQGSIGYLPPVAYAAGLAMTLPAQTVSYSGQAYAPLLSALPFTTSGTFEAAKFRLIQGVAGVDLAAAGGAGLVGYQAHGALSPVRTAYGKLSEWISVADKLSTTERADVASGAPTLDLYAKIVAARDTAGVGGTLRFTAGTYGILQGPTPLKGQTWLFDAGAELKGLPGFSLSSDFLPVSVTGVTLVSPGLDCNKAQTAGVFTGGKGHGIIARAGCKNLRVLWPRVRNAPVNSIIAYGSGVESMHVYGGVCSGSASVDYGAEIPHEGDTRPTDIIYANCTSTNSRYGTWIAGAQGKISGMRVIGALNYAAMLYVGDAAGGIDFVVEDSDFETAGVANDAVRIEGKIQTGALTGQYCPADVLLRNVKAHGPGGSGVGISNRGGARAKIVDSEIYSMALGLATSDLAIVKMFDGSIHNTTSGLMSLSTPALVRGTKLYSWGADAGNQAAITLLTGADGTVIEDTVIGHATSETGEQGIAVSGTVDDVSVRGSTFSGTVTTPLNVTAAQLATWTLTGNTGLSASQNLPLHRRSAALPASGSYAVGHVVEIAAPSVNGGVAAWVCTAAPNTFRPISQVVGKLGIRPTLAASAIGAMHMDTALAAAGKPIWWTGTIWVDALGVAV